MLELCYIKYSTDEYIPAIRKTGCVLEIILKQYVVKRGAQETISYGADQSVEVPPPH